MTTVRRFDLPVDPAASFDPAGSVFFVGTATTIIRFGGFTILTDPNFLHRGEQVRLGFGLRSTRQTEPAMSIGDLPPLDLVVLSHLHDDHFDRVAERELDHRLPIVTTDQAAFMLGRKGFTGAHGLKNWQSTLFTRGDSSLRVTSMPAKHAPGPLQAMLPPAMGSLLEFLDRSERTRLRIYISGDTLIHDNLKEIPRRYPDIDLALVHLGGTRIFGVLLTMDARQGVEALRIIGPRQAIPLHFDDYSVFKSPLRHFKVFVRDAGLSDRVVYLERGESFPLWGRTADAVSEVLTAAQSSHVTDLQPGSMVRFVPGSALDRGGSEHGLNA